MFLFREVKSNIYVMESEKLSPDDSKTQQNLLSAGRNDFYIRYNFNIKWCF